MSMRKIFLWESAERGSICTRNPLRPTCFGGISVFGEHFFLFSTLKSLNSKFFQILRICFLCQCQKVWVRWSVIRLRICSEAWRCHRSPFGVQIRSWNTFILQKWDQMWRCIFQSNGNVPSSSLHVLWRGSGHFGSEGTNTVELKNEIFFGFF